MRNNLLIIILSMLLSEGSFAHEKQGQATYLGNEGVMVQDGQTKVLIDPFFLNDFGHYQLVPEKVRQAMFQGQAPYDNVDAVFISHAHGDHFSAADLIYFLKQQNKAKIIGPKQAIDALLKEHDGAQFSSRFISVDLSLKQAPFELTLDKLKIEAVRIPHAGWPSRAEVQNIVFRLTLNENSRIMHLGDADPLKEHYTPFADFWQKYPSDTAFPPYWFLTSEEGRRILTKQLHVKHSIGVHVPKVLPMDLKASGEDYFHKPTETREIKSQ